VHFPSPCQGEKLTSFIKGANAKVSVAARRAGGVDYFEISLLK